jgi:hypothetical protein
VVERISLVLGDLDAASRKEVSDGSGGASSIGLRLFLAEVLCGDLHGTDRGPRPGLGGWLLGARSEVPTGRCGIADPKPLTAAPAAMSPAATKAEGYGMADRTTGTPPGVEPRAKAPGMFGGA